LLHPDAFSRSTFVFCALITASALLAGCAGASNSPSDLTTVVTLEENVPMGKESVLPANVGEPLTAYVPEDGSEIYLPEPVEVAVMGGSLERLGEDVPIDELIEEAESLGQNIVPAFEEAGPTGREEHSLNWDRPGDASTRDFVVQTAASVETASVVISPASTSAYTRLLVWNDNKYVQNVLRYGTSTWGWVHSRDKHGVTQSMIKKTTMFPRSRTVSGSNIYYQTPAIKYICWMASCSIDRQMDVRVVYDLARQSDNFAKGVITAYCVGPTVCPQWVRDVAG
jgi:hypothetical protein